MMTHFAFDDEQLKSMYDNYKEMASKKPSQVYAAIGGPLGEWALAAHFEDACAARMSYALNKSGFDIPRGTKDSYLGGDGKYYIINAAKMKKYLTKVWGKPQNIGNRIGKVKSAVFFQYGPDFKPTVSGHIDIIYNGKAAHDKYERCTRNTNLIWH